MRWALIIAGLIAFSVAEAEEQGRARLAPVPVADMVVASVDGEPMTLRDLREFVQSQSELSAQDVEQGNFDAQQYLKLLVMRQLIEKEAKAAGISVADEEIDAYIAEIKRQNRVDDGQFNELLRSKGLSLESYRRQITDDILKSRIVGSRLRSKITVSDEDVDRYVKEHPQKLPQQGDVHVEQLFVPADGTMDIAGLRERVVAGETAADAGGKYYADLGYVNEDDLLPELKERVAQLGEGSVSPVIETDRGSYVLRVIDRRGADSVTLDPDLRESIRKELFESRLRDEVERYLGEELPKKYNVEMKL